MFSPVPAFVSSISLSHVTTACAGVDQVRSATVSGATLSWLVALRSVVYIPSLKFDAIYLTSQNDRLWNVMFLSMLMIQWYIYNVVEDAVKCQGVFSRNSQLSQHKDFEGY